MRFLCNTVQLGQTGATNLLPVRRLLRNRAMIGYGFGWTLTLQAWITIDGQADCTAKMSLVESTLRAQNLNLQFQYDDNTDTVHAWTSASTFTGIRCTELTWENAPGARMRTYHSFMAKFEWETHFVNPANFLLDFKESIKVKGGKPKFIINEAVNNLPPEARITVRQTKYTATQSGFAVGLSGYPVFEIVAPYLWGGGATPPLTNNSERGRTTPEKCGSNYRGYAIEWNYEYESASELAMAAPNLFPEAGL